MLASEGARLAVTDIDGEGAERCAREIRAAGGVAVAFEHDVTDEARWVELLAEVSRHFGAIHVLVNNAGMRDPTYSIEDLSLDDWNRQVAVNLTSVFLGCKYVVPYMRAAGGGSIVNLSSVGGIIGVGNGAYGATKGGVRIFSKAMGVRYAPENIRCNSVHPGIMQTNLTSAYFESTPDAAGGLAKAIPIGRLGTPEDIAASVLFLASDEARYITGSEFVVDGGLSAQ
jgi:NAD(P)-dependent dehydrogenase (short-subunit alcohol dehydrogenase family)